MYVALSTMDKWWYPDMGRQEGMDVLKRCIDEVGKRASFT
jgi:20S proteasome subunit beta 4